MDDGAERCAASFPRLWVEATAPARAGGRTITYLCDVPARCGGLGDRLAGSERCQLRASAKETRAAAFDRQLHGTKSNWVCAPRPRSAKAAQDQLRKLCFRHGRV